MSLASYQAAPPRVIETQRPPSLQMTSRNCRVFSRQSASSDEREAWYRTTPRCPSTLSAFIGFSTRETVWQPADTPDCTFDHRLPKWLSQHKNNATKRLPKSPFWSQAGKNAERDNRSQIKSAQTLMNNLSTQKNIWHTGCISRSQQGRSGLSAASSGAPGDSDRSAFRRFCHAVEFFAQ